MANSSPGRMDPSCHESGRRIRCIRWSTDRYLLSQMTPALFTKFAESRPGSALLIYSDPWAGMGWTHEHARASLGIRGDHCLGVRPDVYDRGGWPGRIERIGADG